MYLNFRFSKTLITPLIFLLVLVNSACKKNDPDPEPSYNTDQAYDLQNISYGTESQQKMDIYLPANRSSASTKVFVLIHGGGWTGGDKADFTYLLNSLKTYYPNHAIININYRLASETSPAYTKQIHDIQSALTEISDPKYNVSSQFFLFGNSAGGHLSLLYSYAFDPDHHVKAICNTVGPTDLTDPNYLNNPLYASVYNILIPGGIQNQAGIEEVSPALRVTAASPPTISFYGDSDLLIPSTQMARLHDELTAHGVYNQATMYQGAGHGNWNTTQSNDYVAKILLFINTYFP
ncbi:MAG: putative lipase [Fluviicola sp.]|jgi:acetyl esterase/lipase|uniref:alpha/beta hydrolase n=1 Tax=Fluviicola sp. TaxID=1917219 RepID=UPI002613BCB9|nr:alpha/beta hydrolase [Fluviicola sp.]MDF3026978.1 putative lipase [Fluviicola sp.]